MNENKRSALMPVDEEAKTPETAEALFAVREAGALANLLSNLDEEANLDEDTVSIVGAMMVQRLRTIKRNLTSHWESEKGKALSVAKPGA